MSSEEHIARKGIVVLSETVIHWNLLWGVAPVRNVVNANVLILKPEYCNLLSIFEAEVALEQIIVSVGAEHPECHHAACAG